MKRLSQLALSGCLSVALIAGTSLSLTGCAADTLSGPSIEAYGDGNGAPGSEHNNGVSDGNGAPGSEHNNGKGDGNGAPGSEHNNGKAGGDGNGAPGSEHNNG